MRTRRAQLLGRVGVLLVALLLLSTSPAPLRAEEEDALAAARRMTLEGKDLEAFRAWLAIPGAAHHASALGRTSKADLLGETSALLEATRDEPARARILLVRGDLLLGRDQREAALACYRNVAETLARDPDPAWSSADATVGAYPVEAPADRASLAGLRLLPFALGPGSHRDNWLLRRFIALEAWPEAEAELERLASFHRAAAGSGAYSTVALQFAIDHAFFLLQRGDTQRAHDRLLEPLLRLDLDHVPRCAAGRRGVIRPYGGIARKEFVRLVHGAFRSAGREADLLAALARQVAQGRNEARRVLARLHLQAGRLDRARELELAYIEAGRFDRLSAAIRRGRIFEVTKQLPEAATSYAEALSLPPGPVDLPDPDEDERLPWLPAAALESRRAPGAPAWRTDVLRRLERIHTALGQGDVALDYALRILDADPDAQRRLDRLAEGLERFRTGGRERAYLAWLRTLVDESSRPAVRANAAWLLGDADAAVEHVLAGHEDLGEQELMHWRTRLRERDVRAWRALLDGLVRADPADGRARFHLLHLTEGLQGEGTAALFEDLLDGHARYAFDRRRGPWEATRLTGWGDVAYRLMRLYARGGDDEAMLRLGLRIARLQAPFRADALRNLEHRSGNDLPEQLGACLGLAIRDADETGLDRLDRALADAPWEGAREQIRRRRAASWPPAPAGEAFGWANLPNGLRLLASNEDVLSLAADASRIHAGHPWGVAIYDREGDPVTRVALGTAALSLAAGPDALWVGTPRGVYRIGRNEFEVARLPGDQDLDPGREQDASSRLRDHAAWAVALDGTRLWIATRRDVRAYDTRSGALRIYAPDELAVDDRCDWGRFFVDGEDLWVEGARGARRYDRRRDRWVAPVLDGEHPLVHVLGRAAGSLWGDVLVDGRRGHRPCRLVGGPKDDPPRVEVLTLDPGLPDHERLGRGPWSLHGTWEEQPVFGPRGPAFHLDAGTATLRALPATPEGAVLARPLVGAVPEGLRCSRIRPHAGQGLRGRPETADGLARHGSFSGCDWSLVQLDDGTRILGGRSNRRRHEYPTEDWPPEDAHPREGARRLGGVWLLPPGGAGRRISTSASKDALPDDRVFAATLEAENEDGRRLWVATAAGLAVLDDEFRTRATLGRREGLVADRFDAAAALAGRLYFGSGWDDLGGGLTVFDPTTRVFTSLHPADGLATDRVAHLAAEDDRLVVAYGVQYRRWARDYGYQRHRPSRYDPATGTFSPPGTPERFSQRDRPEPAPRPAATVPWLGGYVLSTYTSTLDEDELHVVCSTHGLLIAPTPQVPLPDVPALTATLLPDQPYQRRDQAWRRSIDVRSPAELAGLLADPNPYVRTRALESSAYCDGLSAAWIGPVEHALGEEHVLVRRAAVALLAKIRVPAARPLLERAQVDPDVAVRESAALGLAGLGVVPDLRILERLLTRAGHSHYTAGFAFYDHLATTPTPEVVALFLRHPLPTDDYAPRLEVIARMGAAVVDHPSSIDLLLAAQRMRDAPFGADRFAQRVLAGGGRALLDRLHAALRHPDRVVRSNAARALGHIGDPSSIPPLIEALQPESGLSRAAAVWALGALRARETLPHLVALYTDARADQRRRGGAGFRVGQSAAEIGAACESLASLESLSREWSELRAPRAEPIDPLDEPLLTPEGILEAVAALGADAAQAFYRRLAAESDRATRCEAARQLANGGETEREANRAVLRGLRTSDDLQVRIAATVSLWVLDGGNELETAIRSWLAGTAREPQDAVLRDLQRVVDPDRLAPFRPALRALGEDPYADEARRRMTRRLLDR